MNHASLLRRLSWPLSLIASVIAAFFVSLGGGPSPSAAPLAQGICRNGNPNYPLCATQTAQASALCTRDTPAYPLCRTQTAQANRTGQPATNTPTLTNTSAPTNEPAVTTNTPTSTHTPTGTPNASAPTPSSAATPSQTAPASEERNQPAATSAPLATLTPTTEIVADLTCAPSATITLSGTTDPGTALLVAFNRVAESLVATPAPDRFVGGGVSGSNGDYTIRFRVGDERPGAYEIVTRQRANNVEIERLTCIVPDLFSTPTATP